MDVFRLLASRPSFRHMALGAALNAFAGYATANWTASFMIRSHQMGTGELGTWLSLIIGFGGAIGVLGGGVLADRLARKDKRWHLWLPALAGLIALPFAISVYVVDNAYMALSMMIVPGIMSNVYLGNVLAMTHGLVGLRMRALASAVLFFIINIIGLGAGPWVIGMVSDAWSASLGGESLRQAMLWVIPPIMAWSICHLYLGSRELRNDLARAPD